MKSPVHSFDKSSRTRTFVSYLVGCLIMAALFGGILWGAAQGSIWAALFVICLLLGGLMELANNIPDRFNKLKKTALVIVGIPCVLLIVLMLPLYAFGMLGMFLNLITLGMFSSSIFSGGTPQ